MNTQDSVYDHSKGRAIVGGSDEREPRYDYLGPFASVQDALIGQALNAINMPAEEIQRVVRPPMPQIQLLPPRFGYRARELGIMDVLNVDEEMSPYPTRVDTYGQAGAEGTSRNAQGQGFW
jgi:hypothetical protein